MKIVIVTAFSPKWPNIASLRWESISRYLSKKNEVYIVTSSLRNYPIREYDIGDAKLIEIPAMSLKRKILVKEQKNARNELTYKLKVEATYILEHILPLSSGGVIFHNFRKYLEEVSKILEPGSILVTSYGPWFTLKIGSIIKKKIRNEIIWIPDFRDPSFNIPESVITRMIFFKKSTERILRLADAVVVVSESMKEDYSKIYRGKVIFLPNGYDGEVKLDPKIRKRKGEITIAYTGSLHMKFANIEPFFAALKDLLRTCKECKVRFVYAGKDYKFIEKLARIYKLDEIVENRKFVSKDKAFSIQRSADLLLLLVYTGDKPREGRGLRTGKVYEYLASGKPIMAIAPQSWEMKDEIEADGISKVFEKNDIKNMVNYMLNLAMSDELLVNAKKRRRVLEKYLYKNLSSYFEEEISKLVGGRRK